MKHLVAALLLMPSASLAQSMCFCADCLLPSRSSFQAVAGSMKPALEPGACLVVRTVNDAATIPVGTIITFLHPLRREHFIKRLIATEGQTVQMIDGALHIDGNPVLRRPMPPYVEVMEPEGPQGLLPRCPTNVGIGQSCDIPQFAETLGDETYGTLDLNTSPQDNTGLFTVPEGHVFVLGDHRDNSTDSRIPQSAGGVGFVPLTNILGVLHRPPA